MKYSRRDISPHKLMAMGKPIKAAKGGAISMGKAPMRSIPVANAFPMRKAPMQSIPVANAFPMRKAKGGSATADRQGRALMAGKMAKNLPIIAPQSAYAKGGSVKSKSTAYDRMQDSRMQEHEYKPMGVAHKAALKTKGGAVKKAEHKRRGGMTRRSWSN